VTFDGLRLDQCWDAELARIRRRIGFIFQSFSLIARLRAWENVSYPLIPRGIPRRRRFAVAAALLERLGLAEKAGARALELSGGEQQRVAAARALAGDPEMILADEPTSNLDPGASEQFVSLLRELHAEGRTVVVASHDAAMRAAATQVVRLAQGRLQEAGA
jgi:putative ABC transport system ATP-binding protein